MGIHCRLIGDILYLAHTKQISGFLVLVDFQKAYDSVEWKYIDRILPLFNIGESFIKWIKILYYDSESTVTNNGYATKFFKLQRSVRQGCPLAAFASKLEIKF